MGGWLLYLHLRFIQGNNIKDGQIKCSQFRQGIKMRGYAGLVLL